MKQYEIYWSDLSDEAQEKFKDLYHQNIDLNPLFIIEIEENESNNSSKNKSI